MIEALALTHLVATANMVGLIWFVQIVHYPLFASIGYAEFPSYERRHRFLTAVVVGPLMAVETAGAALLVVVPVPAGRPWAVTGLALLLALHLSTVLVQVPLHVSLSAGGDDRLKARLVRSNWVRTLLWTVRLVPAVVMVAAGG